MKALLKRIDALIPVLYLVLDGYFGHNNALQMTKQCGLELISKLRVNNALYFPSTMPYAGRGLEPIVRAFTLLHLSSADGSIKRNLNYSQKWRCSQLNVVADALPTEKKSHVLLDLVDAEPESDAIINFRDAKQFWGLEDFMDFRNLSAKLLAPLRVIRSQSTLPRIKIFRWESYC